MLMYWMNFLSFIKNNKYPYIYMPVPNDDLYSSQKFFKREERERKVCFTLFYKANVLKKKRKNDMNLFK